jgi:hypothetical protein
MAAMPQQTIASGQKTWRIISIVLFVVFGILYLIFNRFNWGIVLWGPVTITLLLSVVNLIPKASSIVVSKEGLDIKNMFLTKKIKWAQVKSVKIKTGLLPFFAKAVLETEIGNIQIWNTFSMSTPNMVALFNYYLQSFNSRQGSSR